MNKFLFIFVLLIAVQAFSKDKSEVILTEIELFQGAVKIKIPNNFTPLSDTKVKKTYSGLPTVKMVYANKDESVRIAFGSDDLLAPEQALPQMTLLMKDWLKERLAKNKWKGEGVTQVNGNNFGYLEYILKKPEKNYEFMFFTLYRGQMLSCSIHAPKKGYKSWKVIAEQMMESLRLKK